MKIVTLQNKPLFATRSLLKLAVSMLPEAWKIFFYMPYYSDVCRTALLRRKLRELEVSQYSCMYITSA
jgi:hypothetical protein